MHWEAGESEEAETRVGLSVYALLILFLLLSPFNSLYVMFRVTRKGKVILSNQIGPSFKIGTGQKKLKNKRVERFFWAPNSPSEFKKYKFLGVFF